MDDSVSRVVTEELDPDAWNAAVDGLPRMLVGLDVEESFAHRIRDDIRARAAAFAALSIEQQWVLCAPFVEEVSDFEPSGASLHLKASVAVVVRGSELETAHASGPINSGGIKVLTTVFAAPLSHYLALGRRGLLPPPETSMFAHLKTTYPRAWVALDAAAQLQRHGGGGNHLRLPAVDAPMPDLPDPAQFVDAPRSAKWKNAQVESGVTPTFNTALGEHLSDVIAGGHLMFVPSLKHISRNMDKLMRVMEILLAHDTPLMTTNYFIRPTDVSVRAYIETPVSGSFPTLEGLSGGHRKSMTAILKQARVTG